MAVYAQINSQPANAIRAVVLPPPGARSITGCTVAPPLPVYDGMPALAAVLDTRYKTGGTTTWERPGQA